MSVNGTVNGSAIHHLLHLSPGAVYVFDIHTLQCTFLNDSSARLIGVEPDAATHSASVQFEKLVHPDDKPALLQHFEEFKWAADHEIREITYRIKNAEGRWQLQQAKEAVYNRNKDGQVQQIVGVVKEALVAEKMPATTNDELLHLSPRLADELLKGFEKIILYYRLLSEKAELNAQGAEYLRRLQTATATLAQTVQQAQQYSLLTSQQTQVQPTNLTWVADNIKQKHEVALQAIGAVVDYSILPSLQATPEQLMFVFDELFANAIRYHHPDRPLFITIESYTGKNEKGADICIVQFTDNGSGFDPTLTDEVLQPFVKLHPHLQHNGSGVGLTFCKKIIELHGGSFKVSTDPDEGTSFFITLPWQPA